MRRIAAVWSDLSDINDFVFSAGLRGKPAVIGAYGLLSFTPDAGLHKIWPSEKAAVLPYLISNHFEF
ncbi:hypothetical protein l11_11950 [Neisseria weaveri LMG 5135]|nr:hypothetical protein l13_18470 [Neisseria weaveri ATCC 51223]EGV37442.1 hypothetical protein l11_11950 [Neisseria weaveri LMG 5135]